jgi:hypothetical protein
MSIAPAATHPSILPRKRLFQREFAKLEILHSQYVVGVRFNSVEDQAIVALAPSDTHFLKEARHDLDRHSNAYLLDWTRDSKDLDMARVGRDAHPSADGLVDRFGIVRPRYLARSHDIRQVERHGLEQRFFVDECIHEPAIGLERSLSCKR